MLRICQADVGRRGFPRRPECDPSISIDIVDPNDSPVSIIRDEYPPSAIGPDVHWATELPHSRARRSKRSPPASDVVVEEHDTVVAAISNHVTASSQGGDAARLLKLADTRPRVTKRTRGFARVHVDGSNT